MADTKEKMDSAAKTGEGKFDYELEYRKYFEEQKKREDAIFADKDVSSLKPIDIPELIESSFEKIVNATNDNDLSYGISHVRTDKILNTEGLNPYFSVLDVSDPMNHIDSAMETGEGAFD